MDLVDEAASRLRIEIDSMPVEIDEVEKSHPDVFNILLQILDDGRLDRRERPDGGL